MKRSLFSFATACVLSTRAIAVEPMTIDWSFLSPDSEFNGIYSRFEVPLSIQNVSAGAVLSKTGTPPNPFSDLEQAIKIEASPGPNTVRIRVRPFEENAPSQGKCEFQFRLVDGALFVVFGKCSQPWEPSHAVSYDPDTILSVVTLVPGKPVIIGGKEGYSTYSVPMLSANENYTLGISWNETGESPEYRFFLNGEELLNQQGGAFKIAEPKVGEDAIAFMIKSGSKETANGTFFLGKIQATAE